MRIAPRLVVTFGLLAAVTTAGLGFALREEQRAEETARFDGEVSSACTRVRDEVVRQAEVDRKLVAGACDAGELVDRTWVAMEAGELDERRLALAALVPSEREAFGLDSLVLATDDGEVLGADPRGLAGMSPADVAALLKAPRDAFLRAGPRGTMAGIVSRCTRPARGGRASKGVGLVGARGLDALLTRFGTTAGVDVRVAGSGATPPASPQRDDVSQAPCAIRDAAGDVTWIVATKSKVDLVDHLHQIDRTVALAALFAIGAALIAAVVFARTLGRPIEDLAAEARKVAAGAARPLRVRGTGEVADLTAAFDRMLEDLESTRRRLAATSRVAAWREVARRVAHEVKNPLAPIRAAVETLRRLRARDDPAFDDYFDEATRTVLDEVHRIANIVTEFTRFARLPPPRPTEVDLVDVARGVLALQRARDTEVRLDVRVRGDVPRVHCDKDQIVQVLTNLVQNAIDAGAKHVEVAFEPSADHARVGMIVRDDGPGIAPEIAARLFEPYATNKPQGTGLGLAIAQRIAIEHDGELSYVDGTSTGAAFRLVLPVAGPAPVSEMTPPSSS